MEQSAVELVAWITLGIFILLIFNAAVAFFGGLFSKTQNGWVSQKLEFHKTLHFMVPIGTFVTFPVLRFLTNRKHHVLLIVNGKNKEFWLVKESTWKKVTENSYYEAQRGDIPVLIENKQTH